MPVDVCTTHNRRPSTLTNFNAPSGKSARLPTTVVRAVPSMLTWPTLRLQVLVKSSVHDDESLRCTATGDRGDHPAVRRGNVGDALLRNRGLDPVRAQ